MSTSADQLTTMKVFQAREPQDISMWFEAYQFLCLEAQLLDDDRPAEWLELLAPDIDYEVPIRMTKRRGEDPLAASGWHMKEDLGTLKSRVARLQTKTAWGEDPPSRTRRLIGNLRCVPRNNSDIEVKYNLLLYYGRGDEASHTVIAAERHDVLRRTEQGLRLANRIVVLSHTTLPLQSIGVFL